MRNNIIALVPNTVAKNFHGKAVQTDEEDEEALFVGGELLPPSAILSPQDSHRLWAIVHSKAPVVLTERMEQAIVNYKRVINEVVD